jgi:hypothetical protein
VQILVNNDPFDVTLEQEKTAGEVFDALSAWFSEKDFSITGLYIDNEPQNLADVREWQKTAVDSIQQLDLKVASILDIREEHLSTLFDYVNLLRQALASGNSTVIQELIHEYSAVRSSIDVLINPGDSGNPLSERFDTHIREMHSLSGKPGPQTQSLIEFLLNLEVIIEDRKEEVTDPLGELEKAGETIKQLVPVLEELPVLLQTGKDSEAMQHIITFTELSGKLTRLFSYVRVKTGIDLTSDKHTEGIASLYKELNPIFAEMIDAFNRSDAVLIGDLVEYEIAPRMLSLCGKISTQLAEVYKQ